MDGPSRNAKLSAVGPLIAIVGIPLLIALELRTSSTSTQTILLIAAAVIGAGALLAYLKPNPLFQPMRSTLPLLLFGVCALLVGLIVWNKIYFQVLAHDTVHREIFREPFQRLYAPLYGKVQPAHVGGAILLIAWCAIFFVFATIGRKLDWTRPIGAGDWAMLLIGTFILIGHCANSESSSRIFGDSAAYRLFRDDLKFFTGPADILRNYVAHMSQLGWFGQHYPPGNLLLVSLDQRFEIAALSKWIVMFATVLSVIPVHYLARELCNLPINAQSDSGRGESATTPRGMLAANIATLLYATTGGVLIYCTINTTSIVLLTSSTGLWLLARGAQRGGIANSTGLGAVVAVHTLFSFSVTMLILLLAFVLIAMLVSKTASWQRAAIVVLLSSITAASIFLALHFAAGFNIIECMTTAAHNHQLQQHSNGFDSLSHYLLRSTGNILAYLLSAFPLSILALSALARRSTGATQPSDIRTTVSAQSDIYSSDFGELGRAEATHSPVFRLPCATLLCIAIAGFSGLFYLETERIWLFFTPMLAVIAGAEIARRTKREGPALGPVMLLLSLAISCVQEIVFMHYRP